MSDMNFDPIFNAVSAHINSLPNENKTNRIRFGINSLGNIVSYGKNDKIDPKIIKIPRKLLKKYANKNYKGTIIDKALKGSYDLSNKNILQKIIHRLQKTSSLQDKLIKTLAKKNITITPLKDKITKPNPSTTLNPNPPIETNTPTKTTQSNQSSLYIEKPNIKLENPIPSSNSIQYKATISSDSTTDRSNGLEELSESESLLESVDKVLHSNITYKKIQDSEYNVYGMDKWLKESEIDQVLKEFDINNTSILTKENLSINASSPKFTDDISQALINDINRAQDLNEPFTLIFNQGAHYIAFRFNADEIIAFDPMNDSLNETARAAIENLSKSLYDSQPPITFLDEHPQTDGWSCGYHCIQFAVKSNTNNSISLSDVSTTAFNLRSQKAKNLAESEAKFDTIDESNTHYDNLVEKLESSKSLDNIDFDSIFNMEEMLKPLAKNADNISYLKSSNLGLYQKLLNAAKTYDHISPEATIDISEEELIKNFINKSQAWSFDDYYDDMSFDDISYDESENFGTNSSEDEASYSDFSDYSMDEPENINIDFTDKKQLQTWLNSGIETALDKFIEENQQLYKDISNYRNAKSIYENHEYITAINVINKYNKSTIDPSQKPSKEEYEEAVIRHEKYNEAKEFLNTGPIQSEEEKSQKERILLINKSRSCAYIIANKAHTLETEAFINWMNENEHTINEFRSQSNPYSQYFWSALDKFPRTGQALYMILGGAPE